MDPKPKSFWSIAVTELLNRLQATISGLTTDEAKKRLSSFGANRLKPQKRSDAFYTSCCPV